MKIVIPGGSGAVGSVLRRWFAERQDEVVVISRGQGNVHWDGKTLGSWADAIEGADVVINLAGRTVNCRYNEDNLKTMMDSRVDSTRVIGQAIANAKCPPKVWLQASTATIYAHRFDSPNDERTGIIGGEEPGVPSLWGRSIDIAKAWEAELEASKTPNTRKVALRSAMTMSNDRGSVFDTLSRLTKLGLGGSISGGRQYVSWIHELDFCRSIQFIVDRGDLDGAINVCSPNPLPQSEFMKELRLAWKVPIGLPASRWMTEIGCFLMQTESELILKSRRVVPMRLQNAGFNFLFPDWHSAALDLARRAGIESRNHVELRIF